jgi:dihydrofolate reductase
MARGRVIGRGNTLPWRLPTEMQHFMRTTMGHPVLMGRKTFESMKAPLPGRTNIVLTSDTSYARAGIQVVHTMEEGIELSAAQCAIDGREEMFVAGGAGVYAQALPRATRLYMTQVHADVQGDTFFPEFDMNDWRVLRSEEHAQDDRNSFAFTIMLLERREPT